MERAILAYGVAKQQVEDRPRCMAELAVAVNDRRSVGLEILPDRIVGFAKQRIRFSGLDEINVRLHRKWIPVQEIAPARSPIKGGLIRAKDQAGESIPRTADTGQITPGTGRIAGVDADTVAVDAAWRLSG